MSNPPETLADATDVSVVVRGIGKCYRIYRNPQDRFKQALLNRWRRVAGWPTSHTADNLYREHWALKDVSFELVPGEALGILGRNGAGKSTLLQIIAGTLDPSEGSVEVNGRVTALLELGSGFNPEFTGRENVILNGQILGLGTADILARMDEILGFADIGDFVDQPVKTYSSGMMMRLAFAVQTAVNPRLLIVDEALSVGDMFFQAKCMARIRHLIDSGISLLFVSHDVGAVRQICGRAILLDAGRVLSIGLSAAVTDRYVKLQLDAHNSAAKTVLGVESTPPPSSSLDAVSPSSERTSIDGAEQSNLHETESDNGNGLAYGQEAFQRWAAHNRSGSGDAQILNVQMFRKGQHSFAFDFDEEAHIRVIVHCSKSFDNLMHGFKIRTLKGIDVAFFDTRIQGESGRRYEAGRDYVFDWRVNLPLLHGDYCLACGLSHPSERPGGSWFFLDVVPFAYQFTVAPRREGMIDGFVALPAKLEIHALGPEESI